MGMRDIFLLWTNWQPAQPHPALGTIRNNPTTAGGTSLRGLGIGVLSRAARSFFSVAPGSPHRHCAFRRAAWWPKCAKVVMAGISNCWGKRH